MVQVHGNVCLSSVVVTQTLDWKLYAFDVLSEYDGANATASGPMLVMLVFGCEQVFSTILNLNITNILFNLQIQVGIYGMKSISS